MPLESTIIFVCEHGAAKSIIAAAYFNQIAVERGLAQKAIARGTFPESEISPKTLAGLAEDGLTLIERWKDVPPVSENYEQARDVIVAQINHLVNSL